MLSSPVLEKLRLGDQPKFKANLGYIVSTSLGYRVNTCLERITDNIFKRVTDFVFRYSICALCFRIAIPEIKNRETGSYKRGPRGSWMLSRWTEAKQTEERWHCFWSCWWWKTVVIVKNEMSVVMVTAGLSSYSCGKSHHMRWILPSPFHSQRSQDTTSCNVYEAQQHYGKISIKAQEWLSHWW